MHTPTLVRRLALPVAALLFVSCAGGSGPGWTYAPLGPTPSAAPSVAPTAAPSGAPQSPGGSPGSGVTVDIETTDANPLAFEPNTFSVPAGASVTVDYMNNSSLPHNVNFFDGTDSSAPSLGKSAVVSGPNALETVTFTAPSAPGTYFFWCDVHGNAMTGTYTVE